jgi:SAM-dependent methyltransferase
MIKNLRVPFVNPSTHVELLDSDYKLSDPSTNENFPIIKGVPRFCDLSNYSESFGFQWNKFDLTQIDTYSASDQSEQRFYNETGWTPGELNQCRVLEAGSGAGRFSEVFLRTTIGVLHSIDYSNAVEANHRTNGHYGDRFRLAQASIYELPFSDHSFDRVFCLGVLQHTPSFEKSVHALISKTKVGGEIVVDFYPIKGWYTKFHSKYFLRPFAKRLPKHKLLRLITNNVGWMLLLFDLLCKLRLGVLTRFIPLTDVRNFPNNLDSAKRREWAIMDTFDGLSPEYDNPQRLENVVRMFTYYGCEIKFSGLVNFTGGAAMVVRAIKREAVNPSS